MIQGNLELDYALMSMMNLNSIIESKTSLGIKDICGMKCNVRIILFALIVVGLCIGSIPVFAIKEYDVTQTLESPESETEAFFGEPRVLDENIIAVGERGAMVKGIANAGKAYLFDLDGNLLLSLHAPKPQIDGEFGCTIGIKGGIIAVGEPRATVDGLEEAGQVHLFDNDGNLLKTIKSPEPMNGVFFGDSLGFAGDILRARIGGF